jgi:hypothetical protein
MHFVLSAVTFTRLPRGTNTLTTLRKEILVLGEETRKLFLEAFMCSHPL